MFHPGAKCLLASVTLGLLLWVNACGGESAPVRDAAGKKLRLPVAIDAPLPADGAETNTPPEILEIGFNPEKPRAGETVRVVVEASDADGDPLWLSYRWKLAGEPTGVEVPTLSLRGAAKGDDVEVAVVASDGKDESFPRRAAIRIGNAAPRLDRVSLEPGSEVVAGTPIVVRPDARDPDGDAVTFRYQWKVNDAVAQEEGPVLSTRRLRRGDTVQVVVVATDGADESDAFETPKLPIVNSPPRIVSLPGQVSEDGVFRYRVEAEDPDGDVGLQFHLEDAPSGMSIDSLSGEITWMPASDQLGTNSFSVVADDLQGGRTVQTVEVTVAVAAEGR